MAHRLVRTVWPAFIAACALELLVFAFVDPLQLQWASGEPAASWTRQAVYSAAFFAFWGVCLGACVLTRLLDRTPAELNGFALHPEQRPVWLHHKETAAQPSRAIRPT